MRCCGECTYPEGAPDSKIALSADSSSDAISGCDLSGTELGIRPEVIEWMEVAGELVNVKEATSVVGVSDVLRFSSESSVVVDTASPDLSRCQR